MLTVIKYYLLDPFYSGPMTSINNIPSILKSTYYHSNPEEGPLSYRRKTLHTAIAIECKNVAKSGFIVFA